MSRAAAPALPCFSPPPPESIPLRVVGLDPRAHAHTPLQAFVVSQIDGRRSIAELSLATGVSAKSIAALVARLVDERALRIASPEARQSETRLVAQRDSQRPTIPGNAEHLLAHERPTRPMPK